MNNFLNKTAMVRGVLTLIATAPCLLLAAGPTGDGGAKSPTAAVNTDTRIEAGRYIVSIAGCNDCHTPKWDETGGNVPESEWLTGIPIGWRGPWGTTYASNLRLLVQDMSEDAFITMLKTRKARPPMPWMNVARLRDSDARGVYQFIRFLGPTGEKMPLAVEAGVQPTTPYYVLDPQMPDHLLAGKTTASTPDDKTKTKKGP